MNMEATSARTSVRAVSLSDETEMARIDAFVLEHPDGQLFQRPAWLRAVARGCGQDGLFLVGETRGQLTGILPLTHMRSLLFGQALVSSAFGVGGGILGDGKAARALSGAAVRHGEMRGIGSVELRGGASPGEGWRGEEGAHANFSRALAVDDDAELKAVPRKQRAEVRRALEFDLDVEVGRGARDRDAHYAVYAQSVRNLGTPVFPRGLFDAMLDGFGEQAEILTVRRDGTPLASVLSLQHAGTMMPFWGGGTAEARKWRANDAMYWELMKRARRMGCTRFDFGRSKTGSGAFAFKRNWGFAPEPMRYWVHGDKREISPADARYGRKIAVWKKLPLPIANRLGPLISRGLG